MKADTYSLEHAEIDAELTLENVLHRTNYNSVTRDNLAKALLDLVNRETARGGANIVRPKRFTSRTGRREIRT